MKEKYCSRCKETKLTTEFWQAPDKKDGLRQYCKECAKNYQKDWCNKNRERFRQLCWESRQRLKADILGHYANGKPLCVICGESRLACLTIDHIKGGGTKHMKGLGRLGTGFYQWLKKKNYPKGYQTLCANCQFVKRVTQRECKRIC